jgi:hypothetical protein
MVLEQKSMKGEPSLVVPQVLTEIRDAVRQLRDTSPESVLVSLAEEKLEKIERSHPVKSHVGSTSRRMTRTAT